jgi:hypothetical protein
VETPLHQELKRASRRWLRGLGCCAAACEVRCPLSRWRLDAAGYLDRVNWNEREPTPAQPSQPQSSEEPPAAEDDPVTTKQRPRVTCPPWCRRPEKAREPTTLIIECKASRSDYLRDTQRASELIARRASLYAQLAEIDEQFVKPAEPHLRRAGTFLFSDMEPWDLEASSSPARTAVLRELRKVDQSLHGQTKFFFLARYRLATHLIIAAAPGVVSSTELPLGWGLAILRSGELELEVEPTTLQPTLTTRHRTIRNIASALCTELERTDRPPAERPPAEQSTITADPASPA